MNASLLVETGSVGLRGRSLGDIFLASRLVLLDGDNDDCNWNSSDDDGEGDDGEDDDDDDEGDDDGEDDGGNVVVFAVISDTEDDVASGRPG